MPTHSVPSYESLLSAFNAEADLASQFAGRADDIITSKPTLTPARSNSSTLSPKHQTAKSSASYSANRRPKNQKCLTTNNRKARFP
jgi:hypothetical protein